MTVDPEREQQIVTNIRRIMKQQGWTQRGLAAEIGMPEGQLSKTLTRLRTMRATELADIATALHVTTDDLLSDS